MYYLCFRILHHLSSSVLKSRLYVYQSLTGKCLPTNHKPFQFKLNPWMWISLKMIQPIMVQFVSLYLHIHHMHMVVSCNNPRGRYSGSFRVGGATWPKISWGILRVKSRIWRAYWENFPHIFTGAFAILRYKDMHCTQTMYLAIAGSTYYSIPYLHRHLLGQSSNI